MKLYVKIIWIFILGVVLTLCIFMGFITFHVVREPYGLLFNINFYSFIILLIIFWVLLKVFISKLIRNKKSEIKRAFLVALSSILLFAFCISFSYGVRMSLYKHKNPGLIFKAAQGGSIKAINALINQGESIHQTDQGGWTLLHCAAASGRAETVEYLVTLDIDINAKTNRGETAYWLASQNQYSATATSLINSGADTSVPKFPAFSGEYMGQTPPGDIPKVFMPGIVNAHYQSHTAIVFSPDGTEAFWTESVLPNGGIMGMKLRDSIWTYPERSEIMLGEPAFSPDGKRLYYISRSPISDNIPAGKENIWYMEKSNSGWIDPKPIDQTVNALNIHWQPSVDSDYNLYFSDYHSLYYSEYIEGKYSEPVNMAIAYNPTLQGTNPCISKDSQYLLFSGQGKIFISYRNQSGQWTDRIPLGEKINNSDSNNSPRISPDEKYLFFTRMDKDRIHRIYWVSADFIDKLNPNK